MKQILIVEDDSFLNKMLAYNLTADGYGVTSALNARTAAEAIRQREFNLVLLDINLPDGNGFELCKLIKPQHPDTIVIFLTANDQESDQIWGYEVGFPPICPLLYLSLFLNDSVPEEYKAGIDMRREKCDAPECNPTGSRKARTEHEL